LPHASPCHGDKERAALPNVPALGAQPVDI